MNTSVFKINTINTSVIIVDFCDYCHVCRSFGVLLWEILTLGRTPYPGVENRELLEQIEEHGLKLSRPKSCPLVL